MDTSVRSVLQEISRLDASLVLGDTRKLIVSMPEGPHVQPALDRIADNRAGLIEALQAFHGRMPAVHALHALPVDHHRLPTPCVAKGMAVVRLAADLPAALALLSESWGRPPEDTLAVLAGAFLSRYSGESDITLGSWRPPSAYGDGDLCVLRLSLPEDGSIVELMGSKAVLHRMTDMEPLSCLWSKQREQGYHPYFQILLTFETGRELVGACQYRWAGSLDLNIHVRLQEGGGDLGWEYSLGLFSHDSVLRMAENFACFLRGALHSPHTSFKSVSLISGLEARQLAALGRTWEPFEDTATIHALFERQARLTPDAIAISHATNVITYRQLDNASDRLAHHLRQLGVQHEQFVGVYLGRSPALVCSILAVLKSGAAYLPLDPTYPAERTAYLLQDAGVSTLITEAAHSSRFDDADYRTFQWQANELQTLDSVALRAIGDTQAADFCSVADHGRLAYAIYTSGSTGQPKGVMIEHRNTVCFLRWVHTTFPIHVMQNVLASTSMNFDLSVFEFFGPLTCGGRLTIVDSLLDLIAAPEQFNAVTLINSVPSAVNELVLSGKIPDSVRVVNLAGEPLRRALVDSIYAKSKVESVYNLYGPSEDTTYSTFTLVERNSEAEPSIGLPLPHSQAFILDERLAQVPVGVVGELCLGGASLARGYLNKSELTEKVFIANPFYDATRGDPQIYARLYRTGDRARWSSDGQIEFMGRVDHQAKIRGFRIELGEIEARLLKLADVRECVVVVHKVAGGDQRIVAYVAPSAAAASDAPLRDALKTWLAQFLPHYMMPAAFMVLKALPLLPNGKVNRKALPEPIYGRSGSVVAELATPTQQRLASLWSSALASASTPSAHDTFFELGGHSLLLAKLLNLIARSFGVRLTFAETYKNPGLAQMACVIDQALQRGETCVGDDFAMPGPVAGEAAGEPLSYPQHQLWFADQLQGASQHYHLQLNFDVYGALQTDCLERALRRVVRRHETLRTRYRVVDGEPRQFIHAEAGLELAVVDLSQAGINSAQSLLLSLLENTISRPLALDSAPMLRAVVAKLEAQHYHFMLLVHHIAADGWSLELIKRDLSAYYALETGAAAVEPTALPLQFRDFARWQRRQPVSSLLRDTDYWKQQLSGIPALHGLPLDRARPSTQSFRGAVWHQTLPGASLDGLRRLCLQANTTLFVGLHALLAATIHRLSGDQDIVIGTPVAGRHDEELDPVVGFFVNTLPLRCAVAASDSFAALLRRSRGVVVEAFDHQRLSFAQLTEAVAPQRDLSHSPIFQIMLSLQNNERHALTLTGTQVSEIPPKVFTSCMFDLLLDVTEDDEGARLAWEYSCDLFDQDTIADIARGFESLLGVVVEKPHDAVGAFVLPNAAEHDLAVRLCNETDVGFNETDLLHQGFERQAADTPAATAIRCRGSSLTYHELNEKADALAAGLGNFGIGRGDLVGVHLHRSLDLVVAILAVLKAGAACVPLDIGHTQSRLRHVIVDSGMRWALVHRSVSERLQEYGTSCITIDDTAPEYRDGLLAMPAGVAQLFTSAAPQSRCPEAGALAYVLYTQGSTGAPKGVMIDHRNAVCLLEWARRVYSARELESVLASTSIGSGLSIFELFAPLHTGGQIVLVDSLADLPHLPPSSAVRLIQGTPSAVAELIGNGTLPASVVTVNLAGEPLRRRLVDAIYAQAGIESVCNLYALCEGTAYGTFSKVERNAGAEPAIGRPIGNARAYVMDSSMQLCAIGAVGELYLGGACLARGYHGKHEQTDVVFVENPLLEREGHGDVAGRYRRLFRTGDLARLRADGMLEFIGRVGSQLKLRGFRVAPGEIEAALSQDRDVTQSAVTLVRTGAGESRLVGYVATRIPVRSFPALQLRLHEALRGKLPHYMQLSAIVVLPTLPLTLYGTIDRAALPQADDASVTVAGIATAAEKTLARIWCEVLRCEGPQPGDNFFALGGHSLLLTRLINAVDQQLGVRLSMKDVYEAANLADMAQRIEQATGNDGGVARVDRSDELPLSYAQLRVWFVEQLDPGTNQNNIQVGVRLDGEVSVVQLQRSLDAIIASHDAFRTVLVRTGAEPRQRVLPLPLAVPIKYRDLSDDGDATDTNARDLLNGHGTQVFDLYRAPLLSVLLLKLSEQRFRLNIVVHHLIFDGISFQEFLSELLARYDAGRGGRAYTGEAAPFDYPDYVMWQRDWLNSAAALQQESFWRDYLQQPFERVRLPASVEETEHPASGFLSLPLDGALRDQLTAVAQRHQGTLFNVMHAAFCLLIGRLSGNARVGTGIPVAGRNLAHADRVYGNFLNNLPVCVDVDLRETFDAYLRRHVRETAQVLAHQDLPFERIVELNPHRREDAAPLFNVFFNMLNEDAETAGTGDFQMHVDDVGIVDTKFDLTMYVLGGSSGWDLHCHFRAAFAAPATIERLLGQYERLLRRIAQDSDQPCGAFSLDAEVDEDAAGPMAARGGGKVRQFWPGPVHALFRRLALQQPAAIAIVAGETDYSYRQLLEASTRFATALRQAGVEPGARVAVVATRSVNLVVSIFATLQAGGAFSLINPDQPVERTLQLLGILAPTGVVFCGLPEAFDATLRARIAATSLPCLFTQHDLLAAAPLQPEAPESAAVDPFQPACITFTSGTSGVPKAVVGTHVGLSGYLQWWPERMGVGTGDRYSLLSGLSHDPIQRDIFGSLCTGATLVIPDDAEVIPGRLAEWFARQRISVAHLTPAISQILCDTREALPALKLVFLTGEKLHSDRVYAIKRLNPRVTVLNSYGTTETQRGSTYFVASGLSTYRGTVPVGRWTPDTRLLILNENGNDCSLGEVGEIYIESFHLSNGYLGDPDGTARVLSVREDGLKRYRTGDCGCYLSDTVVRCLGRKDRQINIRGYRADLSEIESACRRDGAVKDVAVLVLRAADDADLIQLVAYVVADIPSASFEQRVMSMLVDSLPSYLVPTAVVSLAALPLTRNGKLDEARLPLPELTATDLSPARNEIEQVLAQIWQDVLGRTQVGANDSFFALGGHSLLALKMSGAVWKRLGVSLPLKSLFERPTIRAMANYIASQPDITPGPAVSSPEASDRDVAALSFAQQRVYFLSQFPEQRSLFNLPRAFSLEGELNVNALHGALQRLVQRHSSLRTMFVAADGDVVQRIDASCELTLEIVDISSLEPISRSRRESELVDAEALAPFELGSAVKLRATLIVTAASRHVLLLTVHHIASDGWSNSILLKELSCLYAQLCRGECSEGDPGRAIQYIDYSLWQRERHQTGQMDDSLGYWRRQLAGLPALHSLPLDRERPPRQTFAGGHFESCIRADVAAALRTLCSETDTTLFMLLNAAWSIVLSRFGEATEIVVGTPVAGRETAALEGAVGCFINNLVLRFDVQGALSFLQYLATVKQTTLDAFAHAEVPFELLVESLNPPRTQSHSPLFQIMLSLQSYDQQDFSLAGIDCRSREQSYPCSKFDLSLYCWDREHGIDVLWEYATALFDPTTVRGLSQALEVVLESIVADPSLPLDCLALVGGSQLQQLLDVASGPATLRGQQPVHALFEHQCSLGPERLAIAASDGEFTYAELNVRADRVARFVRARSARQAPVVGVCLDRTSSLVAALLGVLKAGGSYVPLDPLQPASRLRTMAGQARVDMILTESRYQGWFDGAHESAEIIVLDDCVRGDPMAAPAAGDRSQAPTEDTLAYIIFTSGSTGTPKGVGVGHGALSNLLLAMADAPGIDSSDRLLAVTSIGFDIAGLELFLPLISGAQLHLADGAACKDVRRLAQYMDEHAISIMQATPSMWQLLLDSTALGSVGRSLKILVGGEMLSDPLANRLCGLGSSVWNLYGPTETTIWSMRWKCRAGQRVSIGFPIDNTQCYVLSAGLQLQPTGAVGELYIGGDGLAAGYYRQPELTAQAFVPHPFRQGERLYRTGDLCRQAEDGSLICLGRRDHQIKIRGFRVELGEVEAALLKCEGVAACVVTLATTPSGDACVRAHLTSTDAALNEALAADPQASTQQWQQRVVHQLGQLLPDYMVPSALLFMAQMPLNANGKIDRAALPEILVGRHRPQHVAAQSEAERHLSQAWSEYLQLESVGVTENFFSLGGHSILAMKFLARVNSEYGLSIPLMDFLEAPTIRALAAQIEMLSYLRQSGHTAGEGSDATVRGQEFIF
ncbi:non-ribosomal peptide synthetase [Tahibacter sp.]|uniref:non-ribosomal peptide synthetase n=1 Tax=Tahibacter sp. TaxID=2056211 RepID=UPI0028C467F0|nr:non-ribosomal peptide synthetase [Tahibacter sp.]